MILVFCFLGCRQQENRNNTSQAVAEEPDSAESVRFARGFQISKTSEGITLIRVLQPWPGADRPFEYALVPKEAFQKGLVDNKQYDAVIEVPVERVVVTSTTHIPALEALGVADRLVGFPGTDYISSENTRGRIESGEVANLGNNEMMNTEMTLSIRPDLVVGFGIAARNKAYETLIRSGIPVVYNGDWTEQTPLGKAEWIKFFAPFFQLEERADSLFDSIVASYTNARELAGRVQQIPVVMSGALYKDIWYAPGGDSWAAEFIRDANGSYLWDDTEDTGSLSLSLESVLSRAKEADIWISPSQFTSYGEMEGANPHYKEFRAFRDRKVYTYALCKGETGGLTFFELGPNRPDLILRDLIHIFHPEILPDHEPTFFKPLQ
ncbi:ABC transporter substrate-binding protein [Muriicola marianensis]|uniref:ABC transporter substrate-binding protein n=2 Tax=Muriicola marianensis TaxID=1324801 RepID=A0ABQ1R5S2_9FLAO|nr:ABC transporter substrate-binding protein [Muriicola marianensis]